MHSDDAACVTSHLTVKYFCLCSRIFLFLYSSSGSELLSHVSVMRLKSVGVTTASYFIESTVIAILPPFCPNRPSALSIKVNTPPPFLFTLARHIDAARRHVDEDKSRRDGNSRLLLAHQIPFSLTVCVAITFQDPTQRMALCIQLCGPEAHLYASVCWLQQRRTEVTNRWSEVPVWSQMLVCLDSEL